MRVANPRAIASSVAVKCLVDTGAMFTCLPGPELEALCLTPQWRVPIRPADGRQEESAATEMLGAVSMEQFAFAADPLARTLVPTRVPMA